MRCQRFSASDLQAKLRRLGYKEVTGKAEYGGLYRRARGGFEVDVTWRAQICGKSGVETNLSPAAFADLLRMLRVARFPVNPPQTREAYFYRTLFERHFPGPAPAPTVPGRK